MDESSKRILIVAGEASADLHGSNLIKAVRELDPSIQFYGIGGEKIRGVGAEILFDSSDMAVVGVMEVFPKLKTIMRALRDLKKSFDVYRPDLVILMDYPDFNLHLAKFAQKKRVPVLYYISPQVWAWRRGRVKKIVRLVDKMLVILPFEASFYEKERLDVEFVGHPLVDAVRSEFSREKALERFKLDKDRIIIGLLPGSRKSEINLLLPEMLGAAEILRIRWNNPQFVLPVAPTVSKAEIEEIISKTPNDVRINVIEDNIYDVINVSNVVVVASGSATLEAAIMNAPMVIIYKVSPVSFLIGKLLIKVKDIGLVNLVAGRRIVSELVQREAIPERIAEEVIELVEDNGLRNKMKNELSWVKKKLGSPGASQRAAKIATEMLSC